MARILLVEGMPLHRQLYRDVIAEDGHQVTIPESHGQAVRQARRETPDLLVVDVRADHLHDIQMLRDLRACAPGVPVVVLSANRQQDEPCLGALADQIVQKSADMSGLKAAVREALGGRHAAEAAARRGKGQRLGVRG